MSAYYYLCCKECQISLNLGKKIALGGAHSLVMQGVFSEAERNWLNNDRAWHAVQRFLQDHEGHELVFTSDEAFSQMQLYESADGDELMTR
jgi:hypothetical protein